MRKVMLKRTGLVLVVVVVALLAFGYFNLTRVKLFFVATQDQPDVGPTQTIEWEQGPAEPSRAESDVRPNIIFILADDLGINDITTFGGGVADGRVPTTHIDRLAAEGANFSNAYAGNVTCAPTRAMLMTGRYPTRTGFEFTPTVPGLGRMVTMISNEIDREFLPATEYDSALADQLPSYSDQGLPTAEITVAEILKESGYHTIHIGKWHLGTTNGSEPNAQGFDESLLLEGLLYRNEDHEDVVNARLDYDPIDQFLWARGGFGTSFNGSAPFEPGDYLTDYWTDEALKAIEANRNRPFFMYFAHWGPHTPLQASRSDYDAVGDIEPHALRVYAAMIRSVDRSVGRILEKLEELNLDENTLIVFSSDNGAASYLGFDDLNAPYRGWKMTLFEGGIRAPLMMRWPAQIATNTVIDTPVSHIDVMPTLVEAGGGQLPESVTIDGKSLLRAAMGKGSVDREDGPLFWQSGYTQVVRVDGWKLQVEHRRDKAWLFNLREDPTEQNNLAAEQTEKVAELKALLAEHQQDRFGPLYPYTIESPIPIDNHILEDVKADDLYVYWPN